MSRSTEFEIALSFAGEDRVFVDQVANVLHKAGVRVFYDRFEEANLWGKNLYDYLSDVYQNKAYYTIMFISAHYSRKLWTNHERQAMQARAFQENQEYILPARFDDTPVPGVLPTTGYISLAKHTPDSFSEIVQRKLINSGHTVPSSSIRHALFATSPMQKVDALLSRVRVFTFEAKPIPNATVTAIADNNTTKRSVTDGEGNAALTIPTRRRYQLLIAHPDHPGYLIHSWDPKDDIEVRISPTENTGSIICHSTCHIPGLEGRLNVILDTSNRTYLYAENIAINGGGQQPAPFKINEPFKLEDCNGVVMESKSCISKGTRPC